PSLPVAALHRGAELHRHAGQVRVAERLDQGLQDDRRRRMRRAPRAGVLHGGHHRRSTGKSEDAPIGERLGTRPIANPTIQVDVVSAQAAVVSGEAEFVVLPGEAGELGIYPRHTPLITRIKPGSVHLKVPKHQDEQLIFVAGGILEVQPNVVTVLADTAIRGADLDEAKATEALRRAEEARGNAQDKQEIAAVEGELAMLAAQLAAIRKLRKK